jgi:hypothetical protein
MDRLSGPARRIEQSLRRVKSAEDRVEQATKHMNDAIARVRAPADMASRALGGLRAAATGLAVGAVALGAAGTAGALGTKSIIDAAGYKEQTLVAFKSLLGDAGTAANVYAHAVKFAAATPFDTPGVVDATKQLLSYGFATKDLESVMTSAGNIAAGMGKPLEQAVTAFAALKGGDFGQAFGVGQGFNQLGITRAQLQAEGLVFDKQGSYKGSVEDGMRAVQAIIRRRFGEGMAAQSRTIFGLSSTLQSRPFELFSSLNDTGAIEPVRDLMDNLAQLTDFSKPPGSRIQQRFADSMSALFKAVFGPAAAATAGAQGENLVNMVLDKIDGFARWITVNGPKIAATFSSVFNTVAGAISVVAPVIGALLPFLPAIFVFFQALSLARGLFAAIAAIQALGGVLGALRVALALVGGPWGLLIAAIVAGVMLIVTNWRTIRPAIQPVLDWFVTAFVNVKNFFLGLPAFFVGLWNVVVNVFNAALKLLVNVGKVLANGLIDAFLFLPLRFLALGASIVEGIVNGITGQAFKIKDAVMGVANGAVGWFKNLLGIKSPSRVFAGLGGQLPAGLEQGILGGRGAVQRAVASLAAGATVAAGVTLTAADTRAGTVTARAPSMVSAAPANARGAGGGAAEITLNINLKGEGVRRDDADTIADTVMERVAEVLEGFGFEIGLGAGGEG